MRLQDQVAIVTGGSSGIGLAIARRFLEEGAWVQIADVKAPDTGSDPILSRSQRWNFHRVDVSSPSECAAMVTDAVCRWHRADILVNAAGIAIPGSVQSISAVEMERVFAVNVMGCYNTSRDVLTHMVPRRSGSIIHIASIFGVEGCDFNTPYNVSKGAVMQLMRSMAIDYGMSGIRVNCICPGYIETPMTAMIRESDAVQDRFVSMHALGRAGRPEEVAAAALFLASDESSFVTGHALAVDGGLLAGRRLLAA